MGLKKREGGHPGGSNLSHRKGKRKKGEEGAT